MAKKLAPAVAISFADLRPLFGLAHDDAKVAAVVARAGKVTWTKPDAGGRYAIAKQAGFDILVRRPDGARNDLIVRYCSGVCRRSRSQRG